MWQEEEKKREKQLRQTRLAKCDKKKRNIPL
jgi:hypothetical protein